MENLTDYTNPLLVQDDAAPDSMQYFLGAFKKHVGMTLQDFKNAALKIDVEEGYCSEWLLTRDGFQYCLSIEVGDPYYKLYRTELSDPNLI